MAFLLPLLASPYTAVVAGGSTISYSLYKYYYGKSKSDDSCNIDDPCEIVEIAEVEAPKESEKKNSELQRCSC